MKKILFICFAMIMFMSCESKTYINLDGDTVQGASNLSVEITNEDFMKFKQLTKKIYVEEYTDVLYRHETGSYGPNVYIPIIEADGTALTFTEWKERRLLNK